MDSTCLAGKAFAEATSTPVVSSPKHLSKRNLQRPAWLSCSSHNPGHHIEGSMPLPKSKLRAQKLCAAQRAILCCGLSVSMSNSATALHIDNEVILLARQAFSEEVTFQKHDDTISLAKGALLISAEDQAFMSVNREKDILALQNEGRKSPSFSKASVVAQSVAADSLLLGARSISGWMEMLDALAKDVEALLTSNEARRGPLQVLKAVDTVLFKMQGFTWSYLPSDPSGFYFHHVLTFGCGTAFLEIMVLAPVFSHLIPLAPSRPGVMLSIVYMEVCKRLGLTMEGAAVRGDFLVSLTLDGCAQIISEPGKGGKLQMFGKEPCISQTSSNVQRSIGDCMSAGSIVASSVTRALEPTSNRDILGIVLEQLKRIYWKQASRAQQGLSLTAPLQPMASEHNTCKLTNFPIEALLRPEDLRLAVMASERLLILQPHNWVVRKDHGLLLYHCRRYGEAVQELSICMALAPMNEEEMLQPFVERLHLLRLESTWGSISYPSSPSTLA